MIDEHTSGLERLLTIAQTERDRLRVALRAEQEIANLLADKIAQLRAELTRAQEQTLSAEADAMLVELVSARNLIDLFRAHYEAGGEVPGSFPDRLDAYDAAKAAHDLHT